MGTLNRAHNPHVGLLGSTLTPIIQLLGAFGSPMFGGLGKRTRPFKRVSWSPGKGPQKPWRSAEELATRKARRQRSRALILKRGYA